MFYNINKTSSVQIDNSSEKKEVVETIEQLISKYAEIIEEFKEFEIIDLEILKNTPVENLKKFLDKITKNDNYMNIIFASEIKVNELLFPEYLNLDDEKFQYFLECYKDLKNFSKKINLPLTSVIEEISSISHEKLLKLKFNLFSYSNLILRHGFSFSDIVTDYLSVDLKK